MELIKNAHALYRDNGPLMGEWPYMNRDCMCDKVNIGSLVGGLSVFS